MSELDLPRRIHKVFPYFPGRAYCHWQEHGKGIASIIVIREIRPDNPGAGIAHHNRRSIDGRMPGAGRRVRAGGKNPAVRQDMPGPTSPGESNKLPVIPVWETTERRRRMQIHDRAAGRLPGLCRREI